MKTGVALSICTFTLSSNVTKLGVNSNYSKCCNEDIEWCPKILIFSHTSIATKWDSWVMGGDMVSLIFVFE